MKKTIIALMAAGAALATISCNKAEVASAPETEKQAQTLNLDLNIPSLGSDADTKAMKTGWVAGDKLNIWFDDWNPGKDTPDPDLVITYDGSNWTAGELKMSAKSDGTARSLKATDGKMTVVYEGYNDLSQYTANWNKSEWYSPAGSIESAAGSRSVFATKLIAYSEGVSYTYAEGDNTLTASISSFKFWTRFKVLVKGVTAEMKSATKDYFLKVSCSSDEAAFEYSASGSLRVYYDSDSSCPKVGNGSPNYKGCQRGVLEGDDLAFYYRGDSASDVINISTATDIKFELYKTGETTALSSYTAKNKTLTLSDDECVGISIKYSSFD